MVINWLQTGGKAISGDAELEITIANKSNPQLFFRFKQSCISIKFKGAPRMMIGVDGSKSRLYFMGTSEKAGFNISTSRSPKAVVAVSLKTFQRDFPTVSPSSVAGTYALKYDEFEKLYYISIGALPR